jgi:glycosyltransferase involved in cell wall biosynthesis
MIGGAEKVVQALATDFTRQGHEVIVITTQPRGSAQHAFVSGVSVYYLPVRNLYRPFNGSEPGLIRKALWRVVDSYNVLMMPALSRIIATEQPDIVNTHNISGLSAAIWTTVRRQGIPIVHTMHDQYLLCLRSTMFKGGRNCARQCRDCRLFTIPRKWTTKHVDGAIGVSKFILHRHKQFGYFKPSESKVIYNTGINPPLQSACRSATNCGVRIGFLGQIISTKGVHELIEAFSRASPAKAELWIAGRDDSDYASQLRTKTRQNSNIRWLGYVDSDNFFREIDVLVVPSVWNDTAPLVILEAFNHGVPVLASNRGGIPEFMNPQTGWLYDPGMPNSLQEALSECIKSPDKLNSMRAACLAYAREFNSLPWSHEYIAAYRSAIARHAREKQLPDGSI